MGGTCVKFDCIPTEMFIASALGADVVRNAHRFGIQVDTDQLAIDFAGIMSRMAENRHLRTGHSTVCNYIAGN